MAQCGLCAEVQDALSEVGGQLVLVDRSWHPNRDVEVTSVPLEPAKAERSLACGSLPKEGTGGCMNLPECRRKSE